MINVFKQMLLLETHLNHHVGQFFLLKLALEGSSILPLESFPESSFVIK